MTRHVAAEALGTCILVATVVGSGIMAAKLAGGNQAIALLGNTLPTGAILVVIITILGPLSGAHFNPAVSLVFAARGEMPWREVFPYILAQCAGGILGTVLAHLMFDLAPLAIGVNARSGPSQWLAEAVATFTLVLAILGGLRYAPQSVPWLVGLTITAAYWFTASTSFANPAVTLARGFTTTFAGIAINHVPAFVMAQLVGAAVGALASYALFPKETKRPGDASRVTIYHNPQCGTSRNVLAMIRASGEEPEIIEYLKTPPSRERLQELIARMAMPVRALLREKGTLYKSLGLDDPKWADEQLLDFMMQHPILINRPIVVTAKGVRLCRPSQTVLDLLDNPPDRFIKEDGEVVVGPRAS